MSPKHNASDRLARQTNVFPHERAERTRVQILGAAQQPELARLLVAGTAAAGVPLVVLDDMGPMDFFGPPRHWYLGSYERLATTIAGTSCSVRPAQSLGALQRGVGTHDFVVLLLSDRENAGDALAKAVHLADGPSCRVLTVETGPSGVVIYGYSSPAAAQAHLWGVLKANPPNAPAPAYLDLIAAGAVLGEIIAGGSEVRPGLSDRELVLGYSQHCRRRVEFSKHTTPLEIFAEINSDSPASSALSGRSMALLGAGALGNFMALGAALDGVTELRIADQDRFEPSNLNRQILGVRGVGEPKADVVVRELSEIRPELDCRATQQMMLTHDDLSRWAAGAEVLMVGPDNDEARYLCGDHALAQHVPVLSVGATSATGGLAVTCSDRSACFRCTRGRPGSGDEEGGGHSCALVESDAVVASNMVVAGLCLAETAMVLADHRPANVRLVSDATGVNRLARALSPATCRHGEAAWRKTQPSAHQEKQP